MITKLRTIAIFFLTMSLLISGCGSGQFLAPTLTPTPTVAPTLTSTLTPTVTPSITPSPTSTPVPLPKAGYWIGDTDARTGSSDVNFNIGPDGNIFDFNFGVLGLSDSNYSECTISAEIIEVEADGTFKYIFGEPFVDGEPANTIEGKFDSVTTVSGSYTVTLICEDHIVISLGSLTGNPTIWNAVWNRPVE